jgi:hypothetical protein
VYRCGSRGAPARGRSRGLYVAESASGATDRVLLHQANVEGRLLLTEDKDFGELVFRSKEAVPGLILLRLEPDMGRLKWLRLRAAIESFGDGLLGRYVVVEETRFRSRPLLGGAG